VGAPALDAAMSGLPGGGFGPSFGYLDEMLFGGNLAARHGGSIAKPKPKPKGSAAAGRLGGGAFVDDVGSWFGPVNKAKETVDKITNPLKDIAKFFDLKPGSSKGGGAGGMKAATFEEIQAFFREVNRAIQIGIQGGVAFGTAGNAIPLGGPNSFLNNAGGTLIEQINIKGV